MTRHSIGFKFEFLLELFLETSPIHTAGLGASYAMTARGDVAFRVVAISGLADCFRPPPGRDFYLHREHEAWKRWGQWRTLYRGFIEPQELRQVWEVEVLARRACRASLAASIQYDVNRFGSDSSDDYGD